MPWKTSEHSYELAAQPVHLSLVQIIVGGSVYETGNENHLAQCLQGVCASTSFVPDSSNQFEQSVPLPHDFSYSGIPFLTEVGTKDAQTAYGGFMYLMASIGELHLRFL